MRLDAIKEVFRQKVEGSVGGGFCVRFVAIAHLARTRTFAPVGFYYVLPDLSIRQKSGTKIIIGCQVERSYSTSQPTYSSRFLV